MSRPGPRGQISTHPGGSVDRTALRWHAGVWDLWFLVWGILLALATAGYGQRTANQGT